jgi:XRE family transcriptional regulator, aerobic/anaerobic benzoate catabolism transcriptional regulator
MQQMEGVMLLATLGGRIKKRRKEMKFTQQQLSSRSGISHRFLVQMELGQANISVQRLAEICAALHLPMSELFRGLGLNGPQMLALVGMRGSGKSTIGRQLADRLEISFVELDQMIAQDAEMSLSEIFEFGGFGYYRECESRTLHRLFMTGKSMVLATGGSLVTNAQTWSRLRDFSRTVWLKASPEQHLERVRHQGDLRPMKGHDDVLGELTQLLQSREPLYAQADCVIDTDQLSIDSAVAQLVSFYTSI